MVFSSISGLLQFGHVLCFPVSMLILGAGGVMSINMAVYSFRGLSFVLVAGVLQFLGYVMGGFECFQYFG